MTSVSDQFKKELIRREQALKAEQKKEEDKRAKERVIALKLEKRYVNDFFYKATQTLDDKISEAFNEISSGDAQSEPVIKYRDFRTSLDVRDIIKMKAYKDFKRACNERDIAFDLCIETVEVGTIYAEGTWKEDHLKLRVYPALSSSEKPSFKKQRKL